MPLASATAVPTHVSLRSPHLRSMDSGVSMQDFRYVKDWSQRIDLEVGCKCPFCSRLMVTGACKHVTLQVRSKGDMGQHVVQGRLQAACGLRETVLRLTEHLSIPRNRRSISGRRAESRCHGCAAQQCQKSVTFLTQVETCEPKVLASPTSFKHCKWT